MKIERVFYGCAGPANIISAHRNWALGKHEPTEVSKTFSGQIQDFCRDLGATAYFVSTHPEAAIVQEDGFTLEHRPKRPTRGPRYHLEEIRYAIELLRTARKFRADVALLDSGITFYFAMWMFKLAGIPVVPILHNSLWPAHHRPTRRSHKLVERLDILFWRRSPRAVIGVSPECTRQVAFLAPEHPYPLRDIRAQFEPEYFANIPPPPPHDQTPFHMMFIGRVDAIKGVLDIPAMARWIEDREPGRVTWEICGRGPGFDHLQAEIIRLDVGHIVTARGWTTLEEVREVYGRSHAAIVPTRSSFAEGLAMTAAEAILAGRPLVSNPVVPALELLNTAAVAGRTDDPVSHAQAVLRLAQDRDLYERARAACPALAPQFYDGKLGLRQVLHDVLETSTTSR